MLMRRAARHHLAGELREAASLYRKLLQEDPQHAGALHALGVMAHQTGRHDAAEKLLLRAVATDPAMAAAHDDLGALWLLQGKTEQAAAAFGEAVRVDPRHALAHAHLGAALTKLGRHDEAAVAYQRAVDAAMTSVRRFQSVGIDVTSVTDAIQETLASGVRPVEPSAPATLPTPTLPVPSATSDRAAHAFEAADDEDEEGVVGLTLVPPSQPLPPAMPMAPLAARAEEVGLAYASMGGVARMPTAYAWAVPEEPVAWTAYDDERAPWMAATTDEPAFWALSNGDGDGVYQPSPADDAPRHLEVVEGDVSDTGRYTFSLDEPGGPAADWNRPDPDASAISAGHAFALAREGLQDLPVIEPELGDPRYDAPHAMMGGMSGYGMPAAGRVTATSTPGYPSATNGHPTGQASPLASQASPLGVTDVPSQDQPSAAAAPTAPDNGLTGESTLSVTGGSDTLQVVSPSGPSVVPTAVEGEILEAADLDESEDDDVDAIPVAGEAYDDGGDVLQLIEPDEATEDVIDEAASAVQAESTAAAEPVGLHDDPTPPPEMLAANPAQPVEYDLSAVMPITPLPPAPPSSASRRVSISGSALRLSEDPVMAPRQLAKELRRARRRPAAGAKQAAELHKQGTAHLRQRRVDEAIAALQRLVELQPTSAKAHRDLGAAYIRGDRIDDAITSLQRALELRPRFADAFASLGDAYHLQGRVEDAINCYRQTLSLRPSAASAHSNLLLNLNYQRKNDAQTLFAEHLKWARVHAAPLEREILPHDNDPAPDRQIRVGYVSGDFRRHAVGSFIEPVLAHREPESFHVICYSDVLRPDETTERISSLCDGWRDIRGLSDVEVAEMVRHDQIDILVDLAGHTGSNRLQLFARKPAPVQVTYLGYPNTTGLSTMDYRITDAWADPLGQAEQFHTEQLYRLPRGFLCYQGPAQSPAPTPPPVAKNGYVTFGCFNILAKLTPETLGLWAKIMTVLPNSRIVLKDRLGTFSNPARRRYVQDIFAYHRIAADRLELLGKEPDRTKHLESYGRVDVMLDPFPYNGTTTTCEALWMGVPVITLAGTRHAGRVGVSILKSAGLPEFVATNIEGYARSAVLLARDVNRLTLLRRTLRQKLSASALCDAPKFSKILGMAYREMWIYWCQTRGTQMLPVS